MKRSNGYRIRLVLVGFIVLGGIGLANGATATVGPGAGYDFDTIQAGIDAANEGDTVLVAPGEYVITEPVTFRGKAITVKSETGPDETTIRMGTPADTNRGSVVVFENGETDASVLEGFTITGGSGLSVDSQNVWGGGIFFDASSGTVSNCAIIENRPGGSGGGVMAYSGASPTLIDCTIAMNTSPGQGHGAGACCHVDSSLTMTDCAITGNSTALSGGGVFCWSNSSATLTNCTLAENTADEAGGGLFCGNGSSMTVTGCIIRNNSTSPLSGGGAACYDNASLILNNCIITRNSSQLAAGGVFCNLNTSVAINHCVIVGNTAEGVGPAGGGPWGGGGVACWDQDSVTITNSIIRGNTAPTGHELRIRKAATFSIHYSNVTGGQAEAHITHDSIVDWGASNIDADPLFARLGYWDDNGTRETSDDFWVAGDYHLKSQAGRWDSDSQTWVQDDVTSPCIDAGDPMSPIGWESFPNGGFVNMGAYGGMPKASRSYFGEPVCETIVAGDINGDGQVNRTDLEIMALHWTDEEPLPLP